MNRQAKCAVFSGALALGAAVVCLAFPITGTGPGTQIALWVLVWLTGSALFYLME